MALQLPRAVRGGGLGAVRPLAWAAALVLWLGGGPLGASAWAGPVLILAQPKVPQYAQVVAGYQAVRSGDPLVDLDDEAAVEAALAQRPEIVIAVGSKAFELAQAKAQGAMVIGAAVLGADAKGRKDVSAVPLEPRSLDALTAISALAPFAEHVAAFYPQGLPAPILAEARYAARTSGRSVDFLPVADVEGFEALFQAALEKHKAVWLLTDARLAKPDVVRFMVQACLEKKVLLVGFLSGMAQAGAGAAVGADYPAIGHSAARFAAELLALPKASRLGAPFRFAAGKVWVNARTRQALGFGGELPVGAQVIR